MRDDPAREQRLSDHANAGLFSPFHFHRVFHRITGATPGRFLAAVRMAEAQRLLARTQLRIGDVCSDVGYSSLGTFSTQFRRMVGVSPSSFRILARRIGDRTVDSVDPARIDRPERGGQSLIAEVIGIGPGVVWTVLFDANRHLASPVGHTLGILPGPQRLTAVRAGNYHTLSSYVPTGTRVLDALLDTPRPVGRLIADTPVVVRRTGGVQTFPVHLRARRICDPPMLSALPLLALEDRVTAPRSRHRVPM
ncbi:helix-turn-helix transcriptional regulator [Nocardia sp. NBC_01499]|uniref:helix-turn-helix transcriptional regulator n=1 Tax=Nocardia sp. NBC_01499 TaxID=2903597 RepID=UPI00386F850B